MLRALDPFRFVLTAVAGYTPEPRRYSAIYL